MHYRSTEIDFVNEIDTLHSYSSLRNAAVAAPVNKQADLNTTSSFLPPQKKLWKRTLLAKTCRPLGWSTMKTQLVGLAHFQSFVTRATVNNMYCDQIFLKFKIFVKI